MSEKSHPVGQRFVDRMFADRPYATTILQGHLLIEEAITEALLLVMIEPEHLKGVRFSYEQKLKLLQGLHGTSSESWQLAQMLGTMRNKLAHELEDKNLISLIDQFIAASKARDPEYQWQNERDIDLKMGITIIHASFSGFILEYPKIAKLRWITEKLRHNIVELV